MGKKRKIDRSGWVSRKKLTRSCGAAEDVREVLKILCGCFWEDSGRFLGGFWEIQTLPSSSQKIPAVPRKSQQFPEKSQFFFLRRQGLPRAGLIRDLTDLLITNEPSPIYCKLLTIHFFSVGASVQVSRTRNFISRVSPASRKK